MLTLLLVCLSPVLFVWQDTDVTKFLIDIGLSDLIGIFNDQSLDEIDDLNDLTEADFKEMGINIGKRKKIVRNLQTW